MRTRQRIVVFSWVIYLALLLNVALPGLGLPGIGLNVGTMPRYFFWLAVTAIPVALFFVGFLVHPPWRLANAVAALIFGVPSALYAYGILSHGVSNYEQGYGQYMFSPGPEIKLPRSTLRIYRTLTGGSGAIFTIRQEISLPFGLAVVRNLKSDIMADLQIQPKLIDAETFEWRWNDVRGSARVKVQPSIIFGRLM